MSIDADRHAVVQEGFVGNHAVQLCKRPLAIHMIGLALFFGGFLAFTPLVRAFSNVGQVFKANERVRILRRDSLTHDMIGVLLQPSLSSTDRNQATGRGASAFALQTLSQSGVMIGLWNDFLARIKGAFSDCRRGHRKIANTHINAHDMCVCVGCWVYCLYLKTDQQVECFLGLVIPQFRRAYLCPCCIQATCLSYPV